VNVRIEVHDANQVAYESDYQSFRESLEKFMAHGSRTWADCEGVVDNHYVRAARFAASGDAVVSREALVAGLDVSVAGFAGIGQGEQRAQRVLGQVLTRTTAAPTAGQSPAFWLLAHAASLALRRTDARASLLACSEGAFDARYLRHGDPNYDVVRAIQSAHRGEADWVEHLRRAEVKFDPKTYGTPALVRLERAILRLLEVAHNGTQEPFSDALFEAVKQHKGYWSVGSNRTSAEGLLNIRIAGYAAMGIERGLRLDVESGYIPAWLVLGTEPPPRKGPIPKNPPKKPSTRKRAR
jgi:hypothetical protein